MAAEKLRSEGNTMFTKGCWAEAVVKYGDYISLLSRGPRNKEAQAKLVVGHSNRAETWLKMKKYVQALEDCETALGFDSKHLKSWTRKARALEGLLLHQEAALTYKNLLSNFKLDATERSWMEVGLMTAQRKDRQTRRGMIEQDLDEKWENATPGPSLLASAPTLEEFVGPIKIGRTEKMGRGLFATRDTGEGELLLISNVWTSNRFTTEGGVTPLDETLDKLRQSVEEILNEAKENLQDLSRVQQLIQLDTLGGPYPDDLLHRDAPSMRYFKPVNALAKEDWTVTDEDMQHPALRNSFDRAFLDRVILERQLYQHGTEALQISDLYVLPSLMNHSCVPNVSVVTLYNDKVSMIVRATRPVRAGEELFRAYHNVFRPVDERRILHGNQNCECKRCKLELKLLREIPFLNYLAGECTDLMVDNESEDLSVCSTDSLERVRTRSLTALTVISSLFAEIPTLADLPTQKQDWIRASLARYASVLLNPAVQMLPELPDEHIPVRSRLIANTIYAMLSVDPGSAVALCMCSDVVTEDAPVLLNPTTNSTKVPEESQLMLDAGRRLVELCYGSALKSETVFNLMVSHAGRLNDLAF